MKYLARYLLAFNFPLNSLSLFYIQVWYLLSFVIFERWNHSHVTEALIYEVRKYVRVVFDYLVCILSPCVAFEASKSFISLTTSPAQKMKFPMKNFFSKYDQIRSYLRIWSHLLKKSLMENFIFCAVIPLRSMIKTKGRTIFSLSFHCQNTGMSAIF